MRKLSEAAMSQLKLMATEGSDPDVRAFAARKIGTLRVHLARVIEVEEGLLTTVKAE